MSATVAQSSEEYLKLLAYVQELPDGALIVYDEVAALLGIPKGPQLQSKLRRAILRSRREYSPIPTVGYQLSDARNAMPILTHRMVRIDNQVKRAARAHRVITERHYDGLPPEEQAAVRFLGAVFGAIRLAAENGKKVYGTDRPALGQGRMTIELVPI